MTETLAIALAQINPTVGDIDGNLDRIRAARAEAAETGADLVICGELVVSGYPPEDLVLKRAFQDAVEEGVNKLAAKTDDGGPGILIGTPWRKDGLLYNAAVLLDGGDVAAVRFKHDLPNYGVFDEKRIFETGPLPGPVSFRDVRLGIMICEDMWAQDVTECLDESGTEILIVINGSPFETDKPDLRMNLAVARVSETGLPLAYVNLVGGQDELVFDGCSFVLGADRSLRVMAPAFAASVALTEWSPGSDGWTCAAAPITPPADGEGELGSIYAAMVLGLRDYVGKNGFSASSSACRAVLIRPCPPPPPSMPWGRTRCIA